jgi:hypothetical protein
MPVLPTPGGSDGVYGTELNAFLETSLDGTTGKVLNEALQTDATAPIADAALTNKKYVNDRFILLNGTLTAIKKEVLTGTTDSDTSTTVAVVGATTIFSATVLIDDGTQFRGQDSGLYEVVVSGSNVILSGVSGLVQNKAFRVTVDYV